MDDFPRSEVRILPGEGDSGSVPCTIYPPSPGASRKPALILHLYGSGGSHTAFNLMRSPFARLRRLLWERGCWVAVPELGRSHWMSEKACRTLDSTIAAMIDQEKIDPVRVHILGTSMGAGSGLAYIARRPGVIRSMCAFFPMTDWVQWVREQPGRLKRIAEAHGVAPEDAEPALRAISPMSNLDAYVNLPLLVIHGQPDKVVPVHHSRDFVAALQSRGANVIYRESPDFGHDNALAEGHQEEIADFLTPK